MRKILIGLIALIFIPIHVQADLVSIPDGCYVSYDNIDFCWNANPGDTVVWSNSSNQSFLANQYGGTMAVVMSEVYDQETLKLACQGDFDLLANDYNNLVDQFNGQLSANDTCRADYNELVDDFNRQQKKIKRLRKKIKKLKRG